MPTLRFRDRKRGDLFAYVHNNQWFCGGGDWSNTSYQSTEPTFRSNNGYIAYTINGGTGIPANQADVPLDFQAEHMAIDGPLFVDDAASMKNGLLGINGALLTPCLNTIILESWDVDAGTFTTIDRLDFVALGFAPAARNGTTAISGIDSLNVVNGHTFDEHYTDGWRLGLWFCTSRGSGEIRGQTFYSATRVRSATQPMVSVGVLDFDTWHVDRTQESPPFARRCWTVSLNHTGPLGRLDSLDPHE